MPAVRNPTTQFVTLCMDSESETKLISLITQLMSPGDDSNGRHWTPDKEFISQTIQIISFVKSIDFNSQPKPESKLMSLISQAISLFNSVDINSHPYPLSELISSLTNLLNHAYSDSGWWLWLSLEYLFDGTMNLKLEPEPESKLLSLIYNVCYLVSSMNPQFPKLISLCPQAVKIGDKLCDVTEFEWCKYKTLKCLPMNWQKFRLAGGGEGASHFFCRGCFGTKHQTHEQAPLEIKHPLHPKHPLCLVLVGITGKKCYCCDEDLQEIVYCCVPCDFAINISCVEKSPILSLHHPKWHEHPLYLFSRTTSLTCDVCALVDSTCPFYICPPCGFVVHRRCINLPRVIRISRHPQHRISFTPSFNQGDWTCGICRKKIDNDYGGYSCIMKSCSYAAHSKCATQTNVWDGNELEDEPDEDIGDVAPFERISDGIIQHFSHKHHHLRLDDENTDRDYNEDKLCQACITPIYFGNFYFCMQCDFILHEECANLPRKIYNSIHPHLLTLVSQYDSALRIDVQLVLGHVKLVSSMSAVQKDVFSSFMCSAQQYLSH